MRELATHPRWVCWRYELRDGTETKVPLTEAGDRARTTDPWSWTTYPVARAAAADLDHGGIGFVITESDYCGIDLDHCLTWDGDHPVIAPWAQTIVSALDSYTEVTPSRAGLRVWTRGRLPRGRSREKMGADGTGKLEAYSGANPARFFTVTGEHLAGTPTEIRDRQAALDAFYAEHWPEAPTEPVPREIASSRDDAISLDDAALLDRARTSRDGDKFARLWAGDRRDYNDDDSAADLALCNLLAFWTGRDGARMDRLFRQSGLMRPKWDRKRGDATYGAWTLAKAIGGCRETYTPPSPRRHDSVRPLRVVMPEPADPSTDVHARGGGTNPALSTGGIIGAGALLALDLPPQQFLVDRLLVEEASGFVGGEEKLGKTLLAEHLAVCLALGLPVGGRFRVPARRRVLFIEEEDSVRRTRKRLVKMLRAAGRDPGAAADQADLDAWLRLSICAGASLNDETWWAETLTPELERFQPAVVFFDPFSKLAEGNLNDPAVVRPLLNRLDALRRRFGCVVLIVHHFRKQQGERLGRGSQELAGTYVLGAWAEQSLFLEPRDRTGRVVTLTLQSKDAEPLPHPLRVVVAEDDDTLTLELTEMVTTDHESTEKLLVAFLTATPTEPVTGAPGVTVRTLELKTGLSDSTVRRTVAELVKADLVTHVGTAARGVKLYLRASPPAGDLGHDVSDQGESA